MQKIKELIAKEIAGEIVKINPASEITKEDVLGMFEYPPDNSLGDIALPCFKLSKILRMAPVKIADGLASAISSEAIGKAAAEAFLKPSHQQTIPHCIVNSPWDNKS